VRAEITSGDVNINPSVEAGVLAAQLRGAIPDNNVGHRTQRFRSSAGSYDPKNPPLVHPVAQLAGVAQVDRKTLQPLHRLPDVLAANGQGDNLLDFRETQREAGGPNPVDTHFNVAASLDTLGVGRPGSRNRFQCRLDLLAELLDDF